MPPITAHKSNEDEDHRPDIMPDVGPSDEQRARMRKPRASAAKPDFKDEGGYVASVYDRFNAKRAPEPKPEDA